jgi:D-alanyl-D-alanine carboxypeptidase (penicillin-binding protein 5/6)
MRKRFLSLISIGALLIFLGSLFYFYSKTEFFTAQKITSPLPSFLSIPENNQVSTLDILTPSLEFIGKYIKGNSVPDVTAKSALVYDLTTQKVLYEKNPKTRVPIASLTKVMTAIIGEENKKMDDKYFVGSANLVGENSMGLSAGEILSLDELMYGVFLLSGNDAAETIASNYPFGRSKFIESMNKKALSYGLSNTNFTNPTGLEGDGKQYSTAYDLLVISEHLLKFSDFIPIMSSFDKEILATNTHKYFYLENETNLITSYPGVKGIKTGYTPEAGLCLITYLDYKGHKIVAILLGSQNRRQEMKDLLDYSLRLQGITPPKHQ